MKIGLKFLSEERFQAGPISNLFHKNETNRSHNQPFFVILVVHVMYNFTIINSNMIIAAHIP